MKISLIQFDIAKGNIQENWHRAASLMAKAEGSDVYVLPEMWTTGYITKPEGIAERDCASLEWMKAKANELSAAVCGSVATEEDGKYCNRFYFVAPDNQVEHYDKHHLFTFAGEDKSYTPGNDKVVIEWRGVRFLLQVCYDLRFPIFSRNSADAEDLSDSEHYDVALYVASWPKSRRMPWDILLRARAIENQCYVCGVNRIGNDGACDYNGGTAIIDPYGRIASACPDNEECVITHELDIEKLKAFRVKFPVLADRD